MSLRHALLGFLNYGSMTGYEVKKFFDSSVAHFWNAELSQIYPTLKRLEADGLVEMEVQLQEDRPNRKVYTITGDGRSELIEWLASPAEEDQVREPLMLKVFFGSSVPKEELIRVLRHRMAEMRELIAEEESQGPIAQLFAESMGRPWEALFWQLTHEHGVQAARSNVEWLKGAIEKLEAYDDLALAKEHGFMDVRRAAETLDDLQARKEEVCRDRIGISFFARRPWKRPAAAVSAGPSHFYQALRSSGKANPVVGQELSA